MENQSKPFDPSKPVQTRDGRKARIICIDRRNGSSPEIVALVNMGDYESLKTYYNDGRYLRCTNTEYDLVNVPVKTSTWQNVYKDAHCMNSDPWDSKEQAKSAACGMRWHLGHIRRDYVDGVFTGAEFEPI